MTLTTFIGLIIVTGLSTILGSLPVIFHRYFKDSHLNWWESFGGGVMVSASIFSLFIPAFSMAENYRPIVFGAFCGVGFILLLVMLMNKLTENVLHRRAYLFVFVMGLHNIPEGLAVGVDVAALGWKESLPLTVAIFIQNLPEGLVSSMSFLISGFSVKKALLANGATALIEALSSLLGFSFVSGSVAGLPFLLSFAGACMICVVLREVFAKIRGSQPASFSYQGFAVGLSVCAVLDLIL
jgi:ZIP family zinc transporter